MKPELMEWSTAEVAGQPGHRLIAVLRAPGCAWAQQMRCTMCAFPTEFGSTPVRTEEVLAQLEVVLTEMPPGDDPVRIELFVSGSWLNPDEIPEAAQTAALRRCAQEPRVREILVETRPEYVRVEGVEMLVAAAAPALLEIGIGLETANDRIRLREIKKGFTLMAFEEAARDLAAAGAGLMVYVLLKPPGTDEATALRDAEETARYAFGLAEELGTPVRVALEPCFVAPGTEIEKAFRAGRYRPPWLWSAVEVVQKVAHLGPLQVGLSDEGMESERTASNCERCTPTVLAALARYNETREVTGLQTLGCECRDAWVAEVVGGEL